MSSYFPPRGSTNLFGASGQKAAKDATTAPVTKTVKVRAHTRTVAAKPKAQTTASAPPVTQSVTPGSASDVERLAPNFPGEPIAGFLGPKIGGKPKPPFSQKKPLTFAAADPLAHLRPYYTNSHTLKHFAGPKGDEKAQLNAAQVAAAHAEQVANYGTPGYIARSLLPGGLNQSDTGLADATLRALNAASFVLPGGGVGEAAGIFGLGLKGLRAIRVGKDVAETAPKAVQAAHVAEEAGLVRGAMPGAKIVRGQQEARYSAERAKRAAAARVHLEDTTIPVSERIARAKGELAGELPKINFQGFSELNDQSLQALQTYILDHPHLLPFQKIRASDALTNALAGRVPTRSEIVLLEHVFGKDTAAGLGAIASSPFRDRLLSALNVPRSLMASFDLSAPFRQGLLVSTRHPALFARNFGPMVRAFGSEKVYHATLEEIRARPTYPLMIEAKLPITELGRDLGGREERFASDYAEKLTGGKYGPVRASGRAYTVFLDKTRADVFDHLLERAQAQGINVQDQAFLRSLGKYIGSATGRGDLGAFQEAGKVLNTFFFSPRLLASRLNFLNPAYYARLDPFARKEALRSAIQLAGTLSALIALASRVPGVRVATDPRNPDWGKIRIGNTRIDIAGGFQQELRLLAQLATGVAISSTTGKKLSLTAGGFGQPTRLDIALRFFQGKESPLASLVTDWARGSNQVGQPFKWDTEAVQRLTPLLAQDSYDLYREDHGGVNGLLAAFAGYGVGSVGLGMQTYGPPAPKPSGSGGYFGGSSGTSSGYFSGSGSGSGSPYFSSP